MDSLAQSPITRNKNNAPFLILLVLSVVSFIAAAGMIYHHIDYQRDIVTKTKGQLQNLTSKATQDIDVFLQQVIDDADRIANDLTAKKLSHPEMLARMKSTVEKNPIFYGVAVAYKPFGYDPDRRLYSPYYFRKIGGDGKVEFAQIEDTYDYTEVEHEWYTLAIQKGSRWSEPYYGAAGQTYMTTYSSIFYEIDPQTGAREPAGMVTVDIAMDQIKTIIEGIDLGPSGFGALISKKGTYLYHPNTEYVVSLKNITELGSEKNDKNRLVMGEMAAKGQSGILDHTSTTTGQPAWLVFSPVSLTGWSLQNTFLKRDLEIDVDALRHQLVWIVFWVLAFLLSSLSSIYCKTSGSNRSAWLTVATGAMFIVLAVGFIWTIALTFNPADKIAGVRISDKATLQNITNDYINISAAKHRQPPIYVPTGVFIDSIKFSGPSDVLLTGYVWQKFGSDFPKGVSKEFMISKANKVSIKELDRTVQDGYEIIRSHFEAEVQQQLTHRTYPLERERIGIRFIHKQLNHNIVLTPDLDAYTINSASLLPGLDRGAFISGWKLMSSYYELRERDLNTNFGLGRILEKENFPVLYFNIDIQRNFIDAFISNLTPLIIVSILLFFLLILSHKIETAKVFSVCVAMFFVIVFSHIDIRSKISAQEIFYLEYFYFLTYGSILYVSLYSIGTLLDPDAWLYRMKSRAPQLLFWPVVLSAIFCVTMKIFY